MKKVLCVLGLLIFIFSPALAATVEIENYTAPELKQSLLKYFVKSGMRVDNVTEYSLTTKQNNALFWQDVFFGTNFNPYIELRTFYNFVQDGKNTIINANVMIVSNPNSGFEVARPVGDVKAQFILDNLKRLVQGFYGYGFGYKKKRKYLLVQNVLPTCSKYGELHYGDKITEINEIPIKYLAKGQVVSELYVNEKDKELNIKVKRDKEIKNITLKSYFIEPIVKKEKI